MLSYTEMVKEGEQVLKEEGIEDASNDAWLLLSYLTEWNRASYFLHCMEEVTAEIKENYFKLIKKRKEHMPLQHITGEQDFMGLSFCVDEHVLIPRPETELLVEEALKVSSDMEILDLCTGSGCIAVSMQCLGKTKQVDASDFSEEALHLAKKNAERNHAEVHFIQSDMFQNIEKSYDMILSNPPYIATKEIEALEEEVKCHDPLMALDGGEDGLFFYRIIAKEARNHLRENGKLFLEIGYDQAETVSCLLKEAGFSKVEVKKDLAGCDRMILAELS